MSRKGIATITVLGMLVGASPATGAPARKAPRAQARPKTPTASPKAPRRATPPRRKPPSPGTVGDYDGVTPGLPKMPRISLPKKAASSCYLTWAGFQTLPTGSRLFLQFNRKPTYKSTTRARSLLVQLAGCRVANWNNARPLYTRYFPTPIRYSRVRRRRGGLHLSVLLKKPASPRLSVVKLQGIAIGMSHVEGRPQIR